MTELLKNFTVFEFANQFQDAAESTLVTMPTEPEETISFKRFLDFNTHKVTLQICKSATNPPQETLLAVVEFQNLRPKELGSSIKGQIKNMENEAVDTFLFLVESDSEQETHCMELIRLLKRSLLGADACDDEEVEASADEAVSQEEEEEDLSAIMIDDDDEDEDLDDE